ncbi:hypothetical protein BYT27DRAFT_7240481 [Phlegmacium glaucopus]|nr:hypothetical protein BYT27DRAFT_7240481 [Phlegmacium glaucopus]
MVKYADSYPCHVRDQSPCSMFIGSIPLDRKYLQGTSNKGTDSDKKRNIVFYTLCSLYVLSVVTVVIDIVSVVNFDSIVQQLGSGLTPYQFLDVLVIQGTVFACSDFIAQSILIYRCWIVWGYNIRVVILPSILAFVFLVIWLAAVSSEHIVSGQLLAPDWSNVVPLAAIAMSMTVNALVTCLIVFKIFKMYREVRSASNQSLGTTGGSKIRTVMFIVIESGMILFSIQLARLVATIFITTDAGNNAFGIISSIHPMFNGITPTIILVRVSMGFSFHDQESMRESTIGSLRFVANNPNSISETEAEDVGIVNRDDDIGVPQSDDIEMVDR